MSDTPLSIELRQLIIVECDKEDELTVESIDVDEPLFGHNSQIELDSLDALQLSVALKEKYGVHIAGAKDARIHLTTVRNIEKFILNNRKL